MKRMKDERELVDAALPRMARLVSSMVAVVLPILLAGAYAAGHGWHRTAIALIRGLLTRLLTIG